MNNEITVKCTSKWKLEELFSIIYEFDSSIAERVHHKLKESDDYLNLLVRLSGKTIVTFRELIVLSQNGYPDGALSLARNLYEQFVTIMFLDKHRDSSEFNEYIEDYYLDYELQRIKALEYEAKYCIIDEQKVDELYNQQRSIEGKRHHKKSGGFWWTGKSTFHNVVMDNMDNTADDQFKRFLAQLHLLYKRASLTIHANCMGNHIRLGLSPAFDGVDTSPQTDGHALLLYFATNSFIGITGVVCKEFGIDSGGMLKRLNDLAIFYQNLLSDNHKEKTITLHETKSQPRWNNGRLCFLLF